MNDEIKEILEKMFLNCDTQEEKNKVLDYITNLQEINNNLKEDFKRHIDRINELKQRIEKAVEYINYCDDLSVINDYSFNEKPVIEKIAKKDLLNILNGRSDE